jgi:hypothetical protein
MARMIDAYTGGFGLSAPARTRFEENQRDALVYRFQRQVRVRNMTRCLKS